MNNVQKQYFQEIEHLLPCGARQKKRCIMELEDSVCSFLECNPDAALDDLHNEFGTPDSIAESFLECTSPKEFSQRLSVKRKIIFGVVGVAVALAIVIGIAVISRVNSSRHYHNGYVVETIFEAPPNTSPSAPPIETY